MAVVLLHQQFGLSVPTVDCCAIIAVISGSLWCWAACCALSACLYPSRRSFYTRCSSLQPWSSCTNSPTCAVFYFLKSRFLVLKLAWEEPKKWIFLIFEHSFLEKQFPEESSEWSCTSSWINGGFAIHCSRIKIFTLSCRSNQLPITYFYCIS